MKIISVHCLKESAENGGSYKLIGAIGQNELGIRIERSGYDAVILTVRFAGAVLSLVDAESSGGKTLVGAIAGDILLGPLGALAGASMGSSKRTFTMVLRSPDARVVFEASKPELQKLIGFGMASSGDVAIERETLPKGERNYGSMIFWGVIAALVLFAMVKSRSNASQEAGAAAQASTLQSVSPPEAAPRVTTKPHGAKVTIVHAATVVKKAKPVSKPRVAEEPPQAEPVQPRPTLPTAQPALAAAAPAAEPFRPSPTDLNPSPY